MTLYLSDSQSIHFGNARDATIRYDGTNLILRPDVKGSGILRIEQDGDTLDTPLLGGADTFMTLLTTQTITGDKTFSSANLIMGTNIIQLVDTNTTITAVTNDLEYDVATGNTHRFRVNNATEYEFDSTQADFNTNDLINMRTIKFGVSTAPAVTDQAVWADAAGMNFSIPTGDTFDFNIDGTVKFRFSSTIFTILDGNDIAIGGTTGTKIGTATTQKISFYGVTPVVQPTALTAAETSITFVDENTPDFALASLKLHSDDTGAGFADLNEAQAFVEVVENLQVRVGEIETKLQALGLLA